MNTSDVLSQRLHNQKLSSSELKTPADVVRWLGAVQAQDYHGAKWALALRMRNATHADVEAAFNNGEIIRTHLLRPTWHFVAPEDVRWLLQLTAPHVNRRSGSGYRMFELDDAVFKKSNKVVTRALRGGKHLTRATLKAALNKAGIAADNGVRLAHILLRAELDGIVCSGPRVGKQFTYALFEERVPPGKTLTREEALIAHTRNNAYIVFQDGNLGMLAPGRYADLVVLDRDYFKVPADEIKDIKPVMTMVGGKIVFESTRR